MESDCQVLDIRQPFVGLKLHGIANWRLTFMERGVITKDSKLVGIILNLRSINSLAALVTLILFA